MPRTLFNDGQEIVQSDLGAIGSRAEMELYDRVAYELMRQQQTVVFKGAFKCSNVNGTTSQVALGNGSYYDNTQVDPEPKNRWLNLAANTNVTHSAADATNNRIDLICITPARATIATASRNFKDAGTSVISTVTMNVEDDWVPTLSIVTGTPSGSPAVPSTPAGKIALARVVVTAVTGIAGANAYTDVRPRYRSPHSWGMTTAVSAAYTADLDDNFIVGNANGGAFAITLPTAASCYDASTGLSKVFEIVKVDSSVNAITITANGSDLINGAATQVISNQYTLLRLRTDGSVWYLA